MLNRERLFRFIFATTFIFLAVRAGLEFYETIWIDGIAEMSIKWTIAAIIFEAICIVTSVGATIAVISDDLSYSFIFKLETLSQRLGKTRWVIALLLTLPLPYLFLFSPFNAFFSSPYFRLFTTSMNVLIISVLLPNKKGFSWVKIVIAIVLLGTVFVFGQKLTNVNAYPFALYWSEGNRFWDYSVMFGADRYNYPASKTIKAQIETGRQLLWGLPFLIPNLPIWGMRLWDTILFTVPYILLGIAAISHQNSTWKPRLLFGFWTMLFLTQGPIYTPLVLAAILIVSTRRSPLWLSITATLLASYYAFESRATWVFAVPFWAILLAMNTPSIEKRTLVLKDWIRGSVLGLVGIISGYGWNILRRPLRRLWKSLTRPKQTATGQRNNQVAEQVSEAIKTVTVDWIEKTATQQPLLWDRLWPNATYTPGIVLGLIIATLAPILLVIHLIRSRLWKLNLWQFLAFSGPLLAFLGVGLVASIKIGGGSNLHNLDMFLVTLVLVFALAWDAGFGNKIESLINSSILIRTLVLIAVIIPAFTPVKNVNPANLPPKKETQEALSSIQNYISCANQYGEVLFMDQRQLLTFGLVENVPLIVEYEKKFVMDMAMERNINYFLPFYEDLQNQRFTLIISDRQPEVWNIKGEGQSFAAENNVWIEAVTAPLVEYYESVHDFKSAGVELFMPKNSGIDCP
jgi:hypothetical protein